jgi:hypothetical protein
MPWDIFSIMLGLIVGVGLIYIFNLMESKRNKNLGMLIKAVKKKSPIAFLETDKVVYLRFLEKVHKNLGITPQKEVIIIPKDTVKPCLDLGCQIIHGDLYKSITTPRELRILTDELKAQGWKNEEIAKFFEEMEIMPAEALTKFWTGQKQPKVVQMQKKDGSIIDVFNPLYDKSDDALIDKKINLFKNLSSVVKDFIYSGINRTSIHAMIREIVYQRDLEKGGQRNWLMIGIAIFIIVIAFGFFISQAGSAGLFKAVENVIPTQIKP